MLALTMWERWVSMPIMKSLLLVSQTGTAIHHSPSVSFGNASLAKSIPNRISCLMITSILNPLPRNPYLPPKQQFHQPQPNSHSTTIAPFLHTAFYASPIQPNSLIYHHKIPVPGIPLCQLMVLSRFWGESYGDKCWRQCRLPRRQSTLLPSSEPPCCFHYSQTVS